MLLLFDIVSLLGDNRSMEPKERTLRILVEHNGKAPFEEWMDTLRDKTQLEELWHGDAPWKVWA